MKAILNALVKIAPEYSGEICNETPLGENGFELDSVQILQFILTLEQELNLELVNEDITSADLETVASFANFVRRRLNK